MFLQIIYRQSNFFQSRCVNAALPRIAFHNRKVGLAKSCKCVAKRWQVKKRSCSTKRVLQFPLPTAVRFVVEILLRCLNLNRRKRHYKQNRFWAKFVLSGNRFSAMFVLSGKRFSAMFVLSGKRHLLVVSCILYTPIYFVARLFVTTM